MKAVAAAFVLIVGAAVVLWYGNTLNSWVLGGLIGGLAALLLSIPISLTIFSFFARRHDAKPHNQAYTFDEQAEMAELSRRYDYRDPFRERVVEQYAEEDEQLHIEDARYRYDRRFLEIERGAHQPSRSTWEEDEAYRYGEPERQIPLTTYKRLPDPRTRRNRSEPEEEFQRPTTSRRLSDQQRDKTVLPVRQQTARGKEGERRPASRRPGATGFPGYQVDPARSRYRADALRTARLEKMQQRAYEEEDEGSSLSPRRPLRRRASQSLSMNVDAGASSQSAAHSTEWQSEEEQRQRSRTSGVLPPSYGARRSFAARDEDVSEAFDASTEARDPQTEYLNSGFTMEEVRRPLLRRAPYLYDDDPLLQEMEQQVEAPITRRSSRYLKPRRQE